MNFRSLSVKTAILSGLALAIVFAIGIFVLVQQVGQTIDRQTRAYQAASTASVADEVAASLSAAAATADGVVTALRIPQGSAHQQPRGLWRTAQAHA
ncbi:hypothetical protein N8D56_24470 [Devosia sp. A8/3-2]|nr:hypothetical protein N8D56_24470 [Devosia sp. A8/3-2]